MKKQVLSAAVVLLLAAGCKDKGEERDGSGMFEATEIIVSSEISGRLERLDVKEGDRLKAGQVVGLVDTMQLHWLKVQAEQAVRAVDERIPDVDKVLPGLSLRLKAVEDGGVLEIPVGSEQRVYNALIECRTVMDGQTPVRIYVFEEKTDDAAEARSQENAQWQKMTRIISHEVLNTITPIVSLSDTLLGMTGERSVREGIEVIGESARGLLGFVNGYRALSRVPVPQIHPFRFRAMLDYVLQPLMPDVEALGGRVDISLEDEGMVLFADEQLMRQVFANILKNAVNALRDRFGDGTAAASVSPGPAAHGAVSANPDHGTDDIPLIRISAFVNASDNTEIHISNNGWPIPDADAEHIFDPFFTTRAEGTGVGLALSRQIMRAHSGTIRLDRTDPALTTFILTL